MNKKTVSEISYHWYWLYSLFIVILIISPSLVLLKFSNSVNRQADELFVSTVQEKSYGIPKRLEISSINVDATVESVGLTPEGAMDTPVDPDNVGWYNLGPRPGEQGSAVIDGHLDKEDQSRAVFADLAEVNIDDIVSVIDDQGKKLNFIVKEVRMYNADDDTNEVFNNNDGVFLNLITCAGSWDKDKQNYDQRRVIFTELIK
ncbi:class F sortase [Candidatus Falkowbacteria bacterium]|nr:MAG: class F sortase [Candidatus Falkowbacteria bacterium]